MKRRQRVVIIGAGARGNRVFADLISRHETGFENAGVVEPDEGRRRMFQQQYGVLEERAFATTDEFLAAPRFGDIVFICTPDPTHYTLARAVSEKGYDILLEKPIATSIPDCLALLDVEQTHRNRIFVAHVLRYAPFFRKVKEIIDGGALGEVRHISLTENVGHWHFAHSYVRGNWRRADTSAPIILTKSSHDLDLIQWLVGRQVTAVASFGWLSYFRPENALRGAADRCVDCMHEGSCLYSATRFYIHDKPGWPYDVIATPPQSLEARRKAIAEGPYGRCVWRSDNDVCDNQSVILEFEDGSHATFGLFGQTADNTRKIRILFDTAELTGDLRQNVMHISHFTGEKDRLRVEDVPLPDIHDSHGGGDLQLLHALARHLESGDHREIMTSLRTSLISHVLAFLAEESRLNGSATLPVPDIFDPRNVPPVPRP